MRHGSLFSGIGGFDLAAQWMGWENVFHCEYNEFGKKVLKYYWPEAESFSDIKKTDFNKYANSIDVISGGFPCQPYSLAGKRKGKEDDRHLWPEMCRAIREIKPSWVVGENVYGLVNWDRGLVFHEVQADLEAQGYEVFPYLLPAVSVGAPHRRDRIWFVAYSASNREAQNRNCDRVKKSRTSSLHEKNERWESEAVQPPGFCDLQRVTTDTTDNGHQNRRKETRGSVGSGEKRGVFEFERMGSQSNFTDTECFRLEHGSKSGEIRGTEENSSGKRGKSSLSVETNGYGHQSRWENFPTQSPICDGNDGISSKLDTITFSKWRKESIMAGGNAVVPQLVLQIFKTIEAYELKIKNNKNE